MPKYKNYAGQLITCPKEEGTCWQPDHLTRDQFKLQRKHVDDKGFVRLPEGVEWDVSWVGWDVYDQFTDNEEELHKRPTDNKVEKELYDIAREALGEDSNVIVNLVKNKDGKNPTTSGEIILATAYEKNQSPLNDTKRYIDPVKYNFETIDGEVKLYKKKGLFRREAVDIVGVQRDVINARKNFNNDMSQRGG